MRSLLAIDIGNTNITAGIFKGGTLAKKGKVGTNRCYLYGRFFKALLKAARLDASQIDKTIISSVVPLATSRLIFELNKIAPQKIAIVGRDVTVPIRNLYHKKKEVGQDRLVNAYAGSVLYGKPAVIMDLGTAITFDIVSRKGEYLGGLILPGIEMSLSGLYRKTALLPKVELKAATSIIGKDTVGSIRGGILYGFGAMCDGLVAKYKKILGNDIKVIATGGNASLIKRYSPSIQIVDEDLMLKGLSVIADNNVRL